MENNSRISDVEAMTGGRIKRIKKYVEDETFYFTDEDGLSNENINEAENYFKLIITSYNYVKKEIDKA